MADAAGNRYGPYDIEIPGAEAEALTEAAWFDLNGHITGVKSGGALTFAGLTATLTAIDARVHGSYLIREDPWSNASAPTVTASPRRDMLVARRQRTSGEGEAAIPGKTVLTILQGTPAATPAEPTYDDANDEPQWSWQVPGSGGTVVTDVRDLRRWLLPGGGLAPKLIASADVLSTSSATNGAGYTQVASLAVPAHRPGTLRCRAVGMWTSSVNAAAYSKLQFPAGTDVPGSVSRGRNAGVGGVPVPIQCDGNIPTDGTARTLGIYVSADANGGGADTVTLSAQVWLT